MSFMIAAIFLTSDEPTDWLSASWCCCCCCRLAADDNSEFVEPADGLRDGTCTDSVDGVLEARRDGSMRLQLFGTLTAHRLW